MLICHKLHFFFKTVVARFKVSYVNLREMCHRCRDFSCVVRCTQITRFGTCNCLPLGEFLPCDFFLSVLVVLTMCQLKLSGHQQNTCCQMPYPVFVKLVWINMSHRSSADQLVTNYQLLEITTVPLFKQGLVAWNNRVKKAVGHFDLIVRVLKTMIYLGCCEPSLIICHFVNFVRGMHCNQCNFCFVPACPCWQRL